MHIETKRLIITEFNDEMIESVHINSLDEDTRKFVPDEVFETLEEAKETVDFLKSRYDSEDGPFVYPFLLKSGESIGYVQAAEAEECWEIGYHIAKKYAGKGYTSEAVEAFLPEIMEKLRITTILGICLKANIPSQKVLEKNGFKLVYEGISEYQGENRQVMKYKYSL